MKSPINHIMRGAAAAGLALLVLVFAPVAALADKTLPDAEAAEGWIKLYDGHSLFGWNKLGDADFKIDNGNLACSSGTGGMLATTSQFADFELKAKVRVKGDTAAGLAFRARLDGHPSENGSVMVMIDEKGNKETDWHEIHVRAEGSSVKVTLDGKEAALAAKGANSRGYIAVLYQGIHFHRTRRRSDVEIAEMKLRPLGLEPIFNGKDLSEWSIIPDRKSVFTVVDGAINIKDGNGQIESKKLFKDFAMQISIISNGEHLNSGVFYRGPVGVFWKGYESQVRNHWNKDDRTSPVDYGTGGNYGNQPAREVVSTDHEWFHKTVICEGNHTSVWINGYMVSDFTDVRPVSDNDDGKGGYVPGPGTMHLQGHDPTTDLSFKNIRVVEYPKN